MNIYLDRSVLYYGGLYLLAALAVFLVVLYSFYQDSKPLKERVPFYQAILLAVILGAFWPSLFVAIGCRLAIDRIVSLSWSLRFSKERKNRLSATAQWSTK